jgi:hypothetical protein
MDESASLLAALLTELAAEGRAVRSPIRMWVLSGVERVSLPGGGHAIFKYAREPFTGEADVLDYLNALGMPVPYLVASVRRDGELGMLMEDLGDAVRAATDVDGAAAAVVTHAAPAPGWLPVLDGAALAALPGRALESLAVLRSRDRWVDTTDLDVLLGELDAVAEERALGAEVPPFGLCHSEFHPTSLHLGPDGWRLLDWARAFVGPGLLDLVSWQGTTGPADLDTLRTFMDDYVRAGGASEVAMARGGLPAEAWAMGWHRLWIIDWYLEQATTWINDPSQDEFVAGVVRRHVAEAATCFGLRMPSRST